MRRAALILAASLVAGLMPMTTAAAEVVPPAGTSSSASAVTSTASTSRGSVESRTVVQPRAAKVSGTPLDLLAETPAVPPMRVGYKSGLFPTLVSTTKDARGCTLRNQMLIKLATTKPKVLKGCKLKGGVWYADFGATKLTKASQVKLAKLVPDVYVYGQGASQWTQAQRDAYIKVVPPSTASAGGSNRAKPMPAGNISSRYPQPSSIVMISQKNTAYFNDINKMLIAQIDPNQQALDDLRARFPQIFDGWTVATLLNAQAWGLSLSPSLYSNFGVTFRICSPDTRMAARAKPMPINEGVPNPCGAYYTITPVGVAMEIVAVPTQASTVPVTREAILTGYGTPTGDTISRFMFGIHAPANWFSDEASGADGPIYPETIPDVPVGFLRLWDTETTWKDIEPKNGTFIWRKLDKQIQMGQQLDARVMLVLGQTPAWAGSSSTAMPNNIDDWRDYVSTVCRRYGASISAYEVWNEANLQTFWTGTPEQMADLTKAAFEEIRKCNPSAQVVAANTTSRATGSFGTFFPEYLNALKARGWPADAYSVHSYPTASGGADDRIKGIGQFRAALALSGAPFTTVYDTEVNYGLAGLGEGKVNLSGDRAMTLMARTYIDSARYGFGSTFWFVWTANPDSKFGIQFTRQASSERMAWNTTYEWLVGSRFQRCELTVEAVTVCQFSKGAENFSIVWHGDFSSEPVTLAPGYFSGLGSRRCDLNARCYDFTTTDALELGPSPVRIDGAPTSSGPSETPSEGSTTPEITSEIPLAPVITRMEPVFGPRNKVDVTVTWQPPANAASALVTGYSYSWIKCGTSSGCSLTCKTSSGCSERVASGRTGASKLEVTTPLTEGPGTYQFEVRALSASAASLPATQTLEVKRSDAAPPSNVIIGVRSGKGEVVWTEPDMRSSLITGYEVQVRNLPSGAWVTVDDKANGPRVSFTGSSKLDLGEGKTVIARVRTVLKSGATSIFAASDPHMVMSLLPDPIPITTLLSPLGSYVLVTSNPNALITKFPEAGYQVRYSVDGTTWQLADFYRDTNGVVKPTANKTIFPYSLLIAMAQSGSETLTFPLGTKFQVRAIDDSGLPPSEWMELTVKDGGFWANPNWPPDEDRLNVRSGTMVGASAK